MTKGNIEFSQFSLAPRRKPSDLPDHAAAATDDPSVKNDDIDERESAAGEVEPLLQRLPSDERRERSAKRVAERQDARRKLKNLKRAKERNLRFYVNLPLDQEAKTRLMRAAHENEIHMTIIMQAAIDTYLKDNGY